MAEKIAVQISLEGVSELKKQLAEFGAAGEKAFNQIQASAKAVGGFQNLRTEEVEGKLKNLGIQGEAAIKKIINAVKELGGAQGLKTAETNVTNLAGAFAGLSRAVGPVAVGVAAIGAAFTTATLGLNRFADSAAETARTLGQVADRGGAPFEFMSSLQIAFARGGTSLEQFAQAFGALQDKIAAAKSGQDIAESMDRAAKAVLSVEEAELAVREAQLKRRSATGQLTEQQQKYFDKLRRTLAVDQAELQLREAHRQLAEAEANNLDDLVEKFDNLSKGISETFNPLTKLESKVKAISNLLAGITDEQQAFAKLADIFEKLSVLDRAQIGKALGLSPETIATLSRGSEAIRQMQADIERLGLALDDLDRKNLDDLKRSQSEVAGLWDALKQKMGALAAPAFTSFWEGLADRIRELAPAFLKLGEAFGKIDFTALGKAAGDLAFWLAKIAVQVAQFFEALAKGDTSALDELLQSMGERIMSALEVFGDLAAKGLVSVFTGAFEQVKKALAAEFNKMWLGIKIEPGGLIDQLLQTLGVELDKNSGQLNDKFFSMGKAAGNSFGAGLRASIIESLSTVFTLPGIMEEFRKFGESILKNWEILKRKLSGGLISPAGAAEAPGSGDAQVQQLFNLAGAGQMAQQAVDALKASLNAIASIDIASALSLQLDTLIKKFNELAAAADAAAAGMGQTAAPGGGSTLPPKLAHGGLLGGRGTGTSDSNLAWLSRGEHIMPARAVRQPGVLAFLEALRRSGGNLRGILDDMGHFARGGLVLPAFAAGGAVGSMSHVTIQFPGVPPVGGLRASSAVVDELRKAAAMAQVRSGGRKPSRYS